MKLIALTLLLIVMSLPFHAQKGTVYAPCSIPDSCGVVYSHKQDERCLLTFMKVAKQDSLIVIQQQQIQRADSIIYTQQLTINECNDELKRRRKNVFKAGIGGLIGGWLMGIATFGIILLS
jgi:hypothetical protein